MAGRGAGPDFVEALARGLDVLSCFDADHRTMSLSEVAGAAGLARPTARRLLLTLEELGFVRSSGGVFELTPKVLTLGMAYVGALGLWDIARPHLEDLVARTGESSSMAQLDGSDIVYVARVDRKSTRLNSSHANISYAVFCLKKKTHTRPSPSAPLVRLLDSDEHHSLPFHPAHSHRFSASFSRQPMAPLETTHTPVSSTALPV